MKKLLLLIGALFISTSVLSNNRILQFEFDDFFKQGLAQSRQRHFTFDDDFHDRSDRSGFNVATTEEVARYFQDTLFGLRSS